jgi:hypothetical protein
MPGDPRRYRGLGRQDHAADMLSMGFFPLRFMQGQFLCQTSREVQFCAPRRCGVPRPLPHAVARSPGAPRPLGPATVPICRHLARNFVTICRVGPVRCPRHTHCSLENSATYVGSGRARALV